MSLKQEMRREALKFIGENGFFWLADLARHFGIGHDGTERSYISVICRELHNEGVIMACERRAGRIQYMRVAQAGGNPCIHTGKGHDI